MGAKKGIVLEHEAARPLPRPKACVRLVGPAVYYDGYAFGFRQPVLRYVVRIHQGAVAGLFGLGRLLGAELGIVYEPEKNRSFEYAVADFLMYWTTTVLEKSAHPVFEPARILVSSKRVSGVYVIVQPCLYRAAALKVVTFLVSLVNPAVGGENVSDKNYVEQVRSGLSKLLKSLDKVGLQGFNRRPFLAAAFDLRIPWAFLGGDCFQLGLGANSRWMDSSFTDATPVISTKMARNKLFASSILRLSGLPAPAHALAKSENEAVKIAEQLGYPVVVKPSNLDGGVEVKANLCTSASVRKAYVAASRVSKQVLVEKHVPGRDYRILVVNEVVHGVLERVPGGVTGNGVDTVRDLLNKQNYERKTAQDDRRYLHQIRDDEEAEEQMAAKGLDWKAVPEDGQFVRLRGVANVASGGVPVPVPLDQVHPDNLFLAQRAAKVLRLDVAGIDLLIPNIQKSWFECGAYICEINAQPQMHTTMHKPMLVSMFNGADGRIPVAIVISGRSEGRQVAAMMHRQLMGRCMNAGLVSSGKVWIGSNCVSRHCSGSFTGAKMLCHDPGVDAMIICVGDEQIMHRGWPVDSCNVLIVDSGHSEASLKNRRKYSSDEWIAFAAHLSPELVCFDDCEVSDVADPVKMTFPGTRLVPFAGFEDHGRMKAVAEAACSVMENSYGKPLC